MTESEFQILLERARAIEMTPVEAEQQRRSFAYGNANIENADITRELIDKVADELAEEEGRKTDSAKR
jgi:hypothetical protein